jgi:membrane-associated protease RseP (regulator of RpoE activity)
MKKIPYVHIVLFALTLASTLSVGALHEGIDIFRDPAKILLGWPFSVTLMAILLFHEFSHYLVSKRHHVDATLPYFIPAPTLFGTFGAFIKMKSQITTRNALVDIGASGPIAGFIVSVAATATGLFFSEIRTVAPREGVIMLGDSLLFSGLTRLILGPVPAHADVFLHPVAFAGWIGFFVTAINLLPIGQLDGGHIAYAILGERHEKLSKLLIIMLFGLGIVLFQGWIVWGVLLIVLGFRHPPIIYPWIPLDPRRKAVGLLSLIIFILTFIPVPVRVL